MYRFIYWLILSRLPAEATHQVAFALLRVSMKIPGVAALTRQICCKRRQNLEVEALGLRFPSPLGLAAGFDKDATGFAALGNLGFGFVEIGTVTGSAQPGNPKPRMFRLIRDRGLLNRMGFNNAGSAAAARRLERRNRSCPLIIGANIGKTKAVLREDAIQDYQRSAAVLGPVCDYMVVNVSSPNTPGLRDLQAVEHLRPLLEKVRETLSLVVTARHVPLLVKISPDLRDEDIDKVAQLAMEMNLDGIIATNTSTSRAKLIANSAGIAALGAGGVSGRPLQERSLEVLRRLRLQLSDNVVIISAGGIDSGDQAFARLCAGATLVQAYTGFVYGGPGWPRQVNRRISQLKSQVATNEIGA